MICPFCGKENEESSEKCRFCGYEFYAKKRTPRTVLSDYLTNENTDVITEESESAQEQTEFPEPSASNESSVIAPQTEANRPEKPVDINSAGNRVYTRDYTRENIVEIIASVISITVAVVSICTWYINRAPYDTTLDPYVMILLGIIGIVDTIICTLLEGTPPCTVPGTLIRTLALIFIFEYQNFITVPIFLIIYGISVFYVVSIYSRRKPAIMLGIVSIVLLPFLGYIIAVIGALIMREMTGGRKRKK